MIAHSPSDIPRDKIDSITDVSIRTRDPITDILERARALRALQIDIECGQFENPNRAAVNNNCWDYAKELAQTLGVKVHVEKHGHNYEAWMHDLVTRSLPANVC